MAGEQTIGYLIKIRDEFSGTLSKFNSGIKDLNTRISSVRRATSGLMKGLALPFAGAAVYVLKTADSMRKTQLTMGAIMGDLKKGMEITSEIGKISDEFAVPFKPLVQGMKLIASYSKKGEDLGKKLRQVTILSSAYGESVTEIAGKLKNVIVQGKITERSFKNMGAAGGAIRGELIKMAKEAHMSLGQFRDYLKKTGISQDTLNLAIARLTKEGGNAYKMAQEQAKTLSGGMVELHNAVNKYALSIFNVVIGQKSMSETMGKVNSALRNSSKIFDAWIQKHKELVKWIVRILAALSGFIAMAIVIGGILTVFQLILSPIALVIAGVGVFIILWYIAYKKIKLVHSLVNALWRGTKAAVAYFVAYFKIIWNIITKIINVSMKLAHLFVRGFKAVFPSPTVVHKAEIVPHAQRVQKAETTVHIITHDKAGIIKDVKAKAHTPRTNVKLGSSLSAVPAGAS